MILPSAIWFDFRIAAALLVYLHYCQRVAQTHTHFRSKLYRIGDKRLLKGKSPQISIDIFGIFFDELFLNKGGESKALKLPKMCVFGLTIRLFRQKKKTEKHNFSVSTILDIRYFSTLQKGPRSWVSIDTRYDILRLAYGKEFTVPIDMDCNLG